MNKCRSRTTDCPPTKICNPLTGRCINKHGPTAKKIKDVLKSEEDEILPINKKPCPPGKVRNPHTGRCIDPKGNYAKKIGFRSSSKKRSRSKSMESLITRVPTDILNEIIPYYKKDNTCNDITNKGKRCSKAFAFINSETGKRESCLRYCWYNIKVWFEDWWKSEHYGMIPIAFQYGKYRDTTRLVDHFSSWQYNDAGDNWISLNKTLTLTWPQFLNVLDKLIGSIAYIKILFDTTFITDSIINIMTKDKILRYGHVDSKRHLSGSNRFKHIASLDNILSVYFTDATFNL